MEEAGNHTVAKYLRTKCLPQGPRTKAQAKNKARFRGHIHRARYDACEPGCGGEGDMLLLGQSVFALMYDGVPNGQKCRGYATGEAALYQDTSSLR